MGKWWAETWGTREATKFLDDDRQNGGDVSDRGEKSGVPRGEKWLIVVTLW